MTSTTLDFRSIDYKTDVEQAVALLQTSLENESSKESFQWKHVDNPFGKSYGLTAWDGAKIVGLRLFMFWEFTNGTRVIKALRPVDTVTHPDYRGQGIFKKLTFQGLEDSEAENDLIFNTPNDNSLPGYLKMGWSKIQQDLTPQVSFVIPFSLKKNTTTLMPVAEFPAEGVEVQNTGDFHTHWTPDYIKWRYSDKRYRMAMYSENGQSVYIIFRQESKKRVSFPIILECLGQENLHKTAIRALAAKLKVVLVYHLDNIQVSSLTTNRNSSVVVFRDDKKDIHHKLTFSIGDLEGVL
jgi:hypothetical protein